MFSVLGVALAFFSIQHALLAGLWHCGISWCCVVVLGMTLGHSGHHWVSGRLIEVMRAPLHVLVTSPCSA